MDQVALIKRLMDLHPPRFLFGGWAEDALLHGRSTRPHDDIDLLVPLAEVDRLVKQAKDLGFGPAHLKFAVEEDTPIVVSTFADGFELELIVYQQDRTERAFFDLPFPEQGLRRVWLPEDTFQHPPVRLEGIEVRTISPLALYHVREASAAVFGGFRDKDRLAQAQLRTKFFSQTPDHMLRPRIDAPRPTE